jgi:hypothetical protein
MGDPGLSDQLRFIIQEQCSFEKSSRLMRAQREEDVASTIRFVVSFRNSLLKDGFRARVHATKAGPSLIDR